MNFRQSDSAGPQQPDAAEKESGRTADDKKANADILAPEKRPSLFSSRTKIVLLLLLVVLVTHGLSLWIFFDDETARFFILPREGQWYFPGCFWGNWINLPVASQTYRPLMTISFLANLLLFGAAPWGYHATNLLMHWAAVTALYCWARLVNPGSKFFAATTALLFAVHPLTTQPMWIIDDRAETAVFIGDLVALIGYFIYLKDRRRRWLFVSLAGFIFALLSKETAATLPLLLVASDALIHGRSILAGWRRRMMLYAWYWGLLAVYLAGRSLIFSGIGGYRSFSHFSLEYLFPIVRQYADWLWIVPLGAFGVGFLYLLSLIPCFLRREGKIYRLAFFWIVITLLPVLNLCQKWYLYLPLAGWCLFVAQLLTTMGSDIIPHSYRIGAVALITSALGLGSYGDLLAQKRTSDMALSLAATIKASHPVLPKGAEVRLLLPEWVSMAELGGFFFKADGFKVEKQPSPLHGIVKDLNMTRYLDGKPIFNRQAPSALKLVYDDPTLKVTLLGAYDQAGPAPATAVVRFQYDRSQAVWVMKP